MKIRNPEYPGPPDRKSLLREPEYVDIERLPSGKLDACKTLESDIPAHPVWLACDCCLAHVSRLYLMQHYGFCTGFPNAGRDRRDWLEGAWGFCAHCWALALAGRVDLLVARVVTLNPAIRVADVLPVYITLMDVMHSEPREWESGQPAPPAKW